MLLDHALTELLLVKDYTPRSVKSRQERLADFFSWCHAQNINTVEDISRETVRRYVADLRERENRRTGKRLSSETQHGMASVVRMYLRFCVDEGWLGEDVVRRFPMPRLAKKVVEVLDADQYARLVRATDAQPMLALRDKALLALLLDSGVRADEVCSLTMEHLSITPRESYALIEGKGRRQREVPIGKRAALAIHRYLTSPARRRINSPLVFLSRSKRPLTPNAIDRMLYRLRDDARKKHFQGVRISAHTFRHTYAVQFMQQGGDVYKLSRLLGHESVSTTERYLRAFRSRDARLSSKSVLDNM